MLYIGLQNFERFLVRRLGQLIIHHLHLTKNKKSLVKEDK
ncbi:hypothetical protein Pint_23623 [Pistacia integerrima]|uniref:Uncharacterized protein n=2 Tax=Pistacia TaxID=55512 RepID=A0ACC1B7R9_9ROSI|nr:hypothetical protein Pint_23623 [Pistacia integerrima]KAJ0094939.1 hypothetical protein Patl1_16830 [Pistacia atlantica]